MLSLNPMNPTKRTTKFQETKEHSEYVIDRISALPDKILTQILSSLPTKNAVATSILSKRWKLSWTKVINLDFTHNDKNVKKFVRFVKNVLHHHDAPLLHNFRLFWKYNCIHSHVNSWITTAIARNVCQLVLCLGNKYEVPTSIFSCQTLQSLELKGIMCVPASVVVCLPKLETLKFVSVYFKSKEAFRKIIRECPMLKYLHLHLNIEIHRRFGILHDRSEFRYIISSTSLRRLELGADSYGDPFPCEVQLEASSLEYLKLEGYISEISVPESLSSLVEADCRIQWSHDSEFDERDYGSLVEVIRAFDCAKSLTLATLVMWALSHATIRLSTKFNRLKKLKVGVDSFCCSALKGFLQSSNTLEVLTIHKDSIERYLPPPSDDDDLDDNYYDNSWTAPAEVPRCLSNSLKSVLFDGYSGFVDEREMIGYMLKHGSALEVMHITFHSKLKGSQSGLVQAISNFPRKSAACKIEFSPTCFCDPMGCEMIMRL